VLSWQNRKTFRVLKPKRINLINYNHVLLETYEGDDDDDEDDEGVFLWKIRGGGRRKIGKKDDSFVAGKVKQQRVSAAKELLLFQVLPAEELSGLNFDEFGWHLFLGGGGGLRVNFLVVAPKFYAHIIYKCLICYLQNETSCGISEFSLGRGDFWGLGSCFWVCKI